MLSSHIPCIRKKNIWPAKIAIQMVTTLITVVLSFRDQCSGSHIHGGYLPRSSVFQSFQMSQNWNTNSTNILIQYGRHSCYVLAFLSHLVTLTERRLLKNRS